MYAYVYECLQSRLRLESSISELIAEFVSFAFTDIFNEICLYSSNFCCVVDFNYFSSPFLLFKSKYFGVYESQDHNFTLS